MRVLVTRAEPKAAQTARALEARGHQAIVAPLTDIVPDPTGLRAFGRAVAGAPPQALIAMTSSAALQVLLDGTQVDYSSMNDLRTKRFAVVGSRSAALCAKHDLALAAPPTPDVEALIAQLRAFPPHELSGALYPCAHDRRPVLERAVPDLAAHPVYSAKALKGFTAAVAESLQDEPADAVLAYSARSARLAADAFEKAGLGNMVSHVLWACLSDAVASALRTQSGGELRVLMADKPNEISLLDALDAWAARHV